jgi:hypothetical protein
MFTRNSSPHRMATTIRNSKAGFCTWTSVYDAPVTTPRLEVRRL